MSGKPSYIESKRRLGEEAEEESIKRWTPMGSSSLHLAKPGKNADRRRRTYNRP
jgi:hypothetical protein